MHKGSRIAALLLCGFVGLYFGGMAVVATIYYDNFASTTPHFLRYLLVPGLLSIFFIACGVLLPRNASLMVGLNGAALLGALFAFEALLTLQVLPVRLGGLGQTASAAEDRDFLPGIPVKAMNRALAIEHLPDAMLAGIPRRKTLLCTRDGRPITFDADRLGFNNPDRIYDRPIDVAVLGDSFVEGFCLPPGKDVVSRLREQIPGSVSLATRGNGPLLQLAVLGRYGPALRPRHVVMAFFEGNDWRNLRAELSRPWLRGALAPRPQFGPVPAPAPTLARAEELALAWGQREISATDVLFSAKFIRQFLALQLTGTKLGLAYSMAPRDRPEYAELLRRAQQLTEEWGGRFTLLYLPRAERHLGLLPRDFVFDLLRAKVLAAAREVGVETIDLVPTFAAAAEPRRLFAADGHFSEGGAVLAADAIAAHLETVVAQRPRKTTPATVR